MGEWPCSLMGVFGGVHLGEMYFAPTNDLRNSVILLIMKLYLDNCCFNRPFDDQSQLRIHLEAEAKMRVQEYVRNGTIALAWSYVLVYENGQNPFDERRNAIEQWRSIAEDDLVETDEIIQKAEALTKIGLKSKDALHIACAVTAECDYFLTTDDRVLNKAHLVTDVTIIDPIGFIKEYEQ